MITTFNFSVYEWLTDKHSVLERIKQAVNIATDEQHTGVVYLNIHTSADSKDT